jgi:hypothetical protein
VFSRHAFNVLSAYCRNTEHVAPCRLQQLSWLHEGPPCGPMQGPIDAFSWQLQWRRLTACMRFHVGIVRCMCHAICLYCSDCTAAVTLDKAACTFHCFVSMDDIVILSILFAQNFHDNGEKLIVSDHWRESRDAFAILIWLLKCVNRFPSGKS